MKTKTYFLIYTLTIMLIFTMFAISCNKDEKVSVPVLTTSAVSDITPSTAICGGTITSDGGSAVIARGVCWSPDTTPTINDSKTNDGIGSGTFNSTITGLESSSPTPDGNEYFVRAFATNSSGTGYGNKVSFRTKTLDPSAPIDGGLGFLLVAGLVYGVHKYQKRRKN
jgi:hypothetical protein